MGGVDSLLLLSEFVDRRRAAFSQPEVCLSSLLRLSLRFILGKNFYSIGEFSCYTAFSPLSHDPKETPRHSDQMRRTLALATAATMAATTLAQSSTSTASLWLPFPATNVAASIVTAVS